MREERVTVYDRAREGLALVGVPLPAKPQFLGGGAYAAVYAAEDGRVVKITEDMDERFAAILAMRNPQPHLVRVDHVYALGRHTVLVNERLDPLPPALMRCEAPTYRARWERPPRGPAYVARQYLYRPGRLEFRPEERAAYIEADDEVLYLQCLIGVSLLAAGILECEDAHRMNVMQRPGTGEIVLSDLGITSSSVKLDAPPLAQPGVTDGDDGDVHRDPRPAPPPPPRPLVAADMRQGGALMNPRWLPQLRAVYEVEGIDHERGIVHWREVRKERAAPVRQPNAEDFRNAPCPCRTLDCPENGRWWAEKEKAARRWEPEPHRWWLDKPPPLAVDLEWNDPRLQRLEQEMLQTMKAMAQKKKNPLLPRAPVSQGKDQDGARQGDQGIPAVPPAPKSGPLPF